MSEIKTTCPKCGRTVPLEFNDAGFDPVIAAGLKRLAAHTLCPACALKREAPEPQRRRPEKPRSEYRSPMADP